MGETTLVCPACGHPNTGLDPFCTHCGAALSDASPQGDPLAGRRVGRFAVQEELGRGGMGVIYRAVDVELDRPVALKFLAARDLTPAEEARVRREARALARLDHPNVGTLYEVGEHDGRPFLAMAYYGGETLAERVQHGPLAPAEAERITARLASALAAIHGAGLVHRDVKPGNVLLSPEGGVKLIDFGLARGPGGPQLTAAGLPVGTPAYMAPEQLRGEEVDARTDLWALGAVLYEMLTGRRAFGSEPGAMAQAILHGDPVPVAQLRPDAPPALRQIVSRCLQKRPEHRYRRAEEILAELGRAGRGGMSRPRARRGWRRAAAAIALAAGAALGVGLLLDSRPPAPPRRPTYVAVLTPRIQGSLETGMHALVGANLTTASLSTLAALEGLAPLTPPRDGAAPESPVTIAQSLGADEVLATEADCVPDACQVALQRLAGMDGRVLWATTLRLPAASSTVLANAVAVALRRAYPERALRRHPMELGVEPADYEAFLRLRLALDAGRRPDARLLDQLADLRRRAPGFLEASLLEASVARYLFEVSGETAYLARGREAAAAARRLAPEDPRPPAVLADLALAAGEPEAAEAQLETLAALEPGGSALLVRQARLAEHRGHGEEALDLMREAAALQPAHGHLLTLARMESRLGHLEAARGTLGRLLERSPENAAALQTLAQIELLSGSAERAVELYQSLLSGGADSPAQLTNLGLGQLLLGRYGDAADSFRRAHALAPGNPQITLNLADSLHLAGEGREAAALYRRIAATAGNGVPAAWPVLSARAQALAHLGEGRRAVEVVGEALPLAPDSAQLAYEAALVYALVGDRTSALLQIERARRLGIDERWFRFSWFDGLWPLQEGESPAAGPGDGRPREPEDGASEAPPAGQTSMVGGSGSKITDGS